MLQNRATQVVHVQSLHDNYDCTIFIVIESGLDSVSVSVVDMLAFDVRFGIGQLQRIVNDYDVPAATGYRPVYRSAEPISAPSGYDFGCSIPRNPSAWENAFIEVRTH